MNTMDQVLERLGEIERKAGDVIRRMEEAENLHDSFGEAREGLRGIVGKVGDLVSTVRKGGEDLGEAVEGLKAVIDVVRQSDPAVVLGRLEAIEGRIDGMAGELSAAAGIKEVVLDALSSGESRMQEAIGGVIGEIKDAGDRTSSVNEERTQTMIGSAVADLKETVDRTTSASEKRIQTMIGNAVGEILEQSLTNRVLGRLRNVKVERRST